MSEKENTENTEEATKEVTKDIQSIEQTEHCKNCGTPLHGYYCHHCGQSRQDFQKPMRYLISEFAGNVFAFDTRLLKSIRALGIQPGKYTLDYVQGHRVPYVPPFRFFVFVSFLFFLVLSIFLKNSIEVNNQKTKDLKTAINEKLEKETQHTDSLKIDLEIKNEELKKIEKIKEKVFVILNNPGIYMDNFLKFLSWSLFFLIPIYAFLLWLFFRKTQPYYFSHLILAINQHSFIYVFSTLLIGFKILFPVRTYYPENHLFWLLPIYFYLGYLKLYKTPWLRSLFKSLGILFLYTMALTLVMSVAIVFWVRNEFL